MNNPVIITGHTDSRPVEGAPFYSNWALSSARALAVMRYLAGRGIPFQRMAAYGMGSQRPITSNDNEAGRRLNQRMEITIFGNLPGDMQKKAGGLIEPKEQPIKTYQYKGFEFELEEQ
jgi:chemotaxis protein MotB